MEELRKANIHESLLKKTTLKQNPSISEAKQNREALQCTSPGSRISGTFNPVKKELTLSKYTL